jgi:hypothetical protein
MTDDAWMRVRLQHVAAYRELCRQVRRGGRMNVFFALLMLFLAYVTFPPNPAAGLPLLFLVYVGLALLELAVGLFKFVYPSAEGVLLDGLVLITFAAYNFGIQFLRLGAGGNVSMIGVFFGVYMVYLSISRFKDYGVLRRLFADRPSAELLAWVDDLAAEIRAADPHTDELALDLPTIPHLRAKLLGSTAFFVAAGGDTVWVAGPDEFRLEREAKDHGTGRRRARLRIGDRYYPEFGLADASWENYRKWMRGHAAHEPALPPDRA